MNKILPVSALLGCVLLAASCSQQVQPVKKQAEVRFTWEKWNGFTPATTMC